MRDKQTRDNKDFDTIFSNWRYISIVSFVFSPVQWDGQNLTLRNLVLEANALNQLVQHSASYFCGFFSSLSSLIKQLEGFKLSSTVSLEPLSLIKNFSGEYTFRNLLTFQYSLKA